MFRRASAAALLALFLFGLPAEAAEIIFIVRHAERETGQGDDPLSAAGRARAERLATMLRDAGITHVFTSDRRRTVETGAPVARGAMIMSFVIALPESAPSGGDPAQRQVDLTVQSVKEAPAFSRVLIVGHSNTVPLLLKALGVTEAITLPDTEFDNLFIVTLRGSGAPAFARLRY
jgi:broad specificity phosphatase PhoE